MHNRFVHSIGVYHLGRIASDTLLEYINNELQDKLSLFNTFCSLYPLLSDTGIVELDLILDNVLKDKKLYTEEEVKSILKRFSSEVTVMKYTDNQLDRYL